jgi:outer membrane protein TolC
MQLTTTGRSPFETILLMFFCVIGLLTVRDTAGAQNRTQLPLTLPQAIDLALNQNRDLKLARLAVVETGHKKEIAHAAYFPQISNESAVVHLTELAGVEIPAGAFGVHPETGAIPAANLFLDQGGLTSYTSGTGLAQPFTQMFKIHESNRAATADINTAKIQVDQAQNEVALKVRQLYYGILVAQLRQQAAADEVDANQVKVQENTDAVARGSALDVVLIESRASLLDARQAALKQKLQIQDLSVQLDDLLGLPLTTDLRLDAETSPASSLTIPSREECDRIAREHSPEIRAAEQAVVKAKAGLSASKDAYIPNITGLARYSYQSGIPFLVHNFGSFGLSFTYDLFDGGRRNAEIKDSRTLLSEAELSLVKAEEQVAVQVEQAYNKVVQQQDLVGVSEELLSARTEAARLTDREFEQEAALASARAAAHAKAASAKASSLEAHLGLELAEGELIETIGQLPR